MLRRRGGDGIHRLQEAMLRGVEEQAYIRPSSRSHGDAWTRIEIVQRGHQRGEEVPIEPID